MSATSLSDAIVRVEALQLHFDAGKIKALDGIDIAFGDGEFVALVGPSGCGKSILLNVIGTLDSPTAGQVWFRSRAYAAIGDPSLFRRRHVGFIFQSFHLIPTLSALDNVVVATIGTPGAAIDHQEKARELLSRLGLRHRLQLHRPVLRPCPYL